MPNAPSIAAGARRIVQRCLGLEQGQDLVIFADETTVDTAVALADAAEGLRVHSTLLLLPVSQQRRIPHQADLSIPVQGLAHQARGILTCVNAQPDCLPFRNRVLETQWSARTRVGHMPGATLEVLELADVDQDRVSADCHAVEVALARGRRIELITFAPDGKEHHLQADIGGWERLPVASDGVITDGAWGNVPSGETYIAPIEGTAEGSVAITGSLPGRVLLPGEVLVLHVQAGRLVRLDPPGADAARWLEERQIQKAKARGDLNWSSLAEIGIGLNPRVTRLTGNMLIDEKAATTAHVALGTNSFMGGWVTASIHCDMVTRNPTVRVDGATIVEAGRLLTSEEQWREHYGQVRLDESPYGAAVQVSRSGIQAGENAEGRLYRVLRPEPGRVSGCFAGDDATAWLAATVYRLLPVEGGWIGVDTLASHAGVERTTLRRVLHIMGMYGLVNIRS